MSAEHHARWSADEVIARAFSSISSYERTRLASRPEQRRVRGAFYTPPSIASALAECALRPHLDRCTSADDVRAIRVLDPACGAGALLVAALHVLARAHARFAGDGQEITPDDLCTVTGCLFGIDIDRDALETCRAVIAAIVEPDANWPEPSLSPGDSLLDALPDDWPARFDAIVANPPFGSVGRLERGAPRRTALRARYPDVWQDKMDLAAFFVARGLELGPSAAFVVPSAMLRSDKGRRARAHLRARASVRFLEAPERELFDDAAVAAGLLTWQTAPLTSGASADRVEGWRVSSGEERVWKTTLEAFAERRTLASSDVVVDDGVRGPRWHAWSRERRARWRQMDDVGTPIGDRYLIGKGMETGYNRGFELPTSVLRKLTELQRERFVRERVRNSDIGRLAARASGVHLAWPCEIEAFDDLPPPIRRWLRRHEKRLRARAAHRRGDCRWWQWTWPLHSDATASCWRVVTPYRAREHRFAVLGPGGRIGLTDTTSIFIPHTNARAAQQLGDTANSDPVAATSRATALAALLCSSPIVDRYAGLTKPTGNGMLEFFENQLREIPLPPGWPVQAPEICAAIETPRGPCWRTIDAVVEQAYGLEGSRQGTDRKGRRSPAS